MRVVLGAAYECALDEAVDYLLGVGAQTAAQQLLDEAYDVLPQRLAQLPHIGRAFVAQHPEAADVRSVWAAVCELLGQDIELREYVFGDYLVLYAIQGNTLHLLTLRHHRQSGFHFDETWRDESPA